MGQPRHRNKGAQPVPKAVYENMTGIVINATAYSVMIQLRNLSYCDITGCVLIQPNQFPQDFRQISRIDFF